MTVVLLERDPESRRIEVATLRYGGYDVARARTVEQAITMLRARRAGAVLVDPGRSDAAKIVETLRARTDLPIFVIGEFAGEMDVVAVLDALHWHGTVRDAIPSWRWRFPLRELTRRSRVCRLAIQGR